MISEESTAHDQLIAIIISGQLLCYVTLLPPQRT